MSINGDVAQEALAFGNEDLTWMISENLLKNLKKKKKNRRAAARMDRNLVLKINR